MSIGKFAEYVGLSRKGVREIDRGLTREIQPATIAKIVSGTRIPWCVIVPVALDKDGDPIERPLSPSEEEIVAVDDSHMLAPRDARRIRELLASPDVHDPTVTDVLYVPRVPKPMVDSGSQHQQRAHNRAKK